MKDERQPSAPPRFVRTRYQGSKQRLIPFLDDAIGGLPFDTAVDVFGGTGAVSHFLKRLGKRVHYNDTLAANVVSGVALIENARVVASNATARLLASRDPGKTYDDFIERTFEGVFYLPEENRWLDTVVQNAREIGCRFERSLVFHAIFQACLMKRPFNLFHRRNLDVRLASVPRSFGNKTTWERSFDALLVSALEEANAAVFDNGRPNLATRFDAFDCPLDSELVYLDPPYVRSDGAAFSYRDGYHFLEGLTEYDRWGERIDHRKKHLPYAGPKSVFEDARTVEPALFELMAKAREARFVVLSYRRDGRPSVDDIVATLAKLGRTTTVYERPGTYALSRRPTADILVVGR